MSIAIQPLNNFETNTRRARDVAETRTSRGRRSTAATQRVTGRRIPQGEPTPERAAKGDLAAPRTPGSFYRCMAPIERLRDGNKLDHHAHINDGMFEAAQKLRRHFDGCRTGLKAQDLDRVVSGTADGLKAEENWVHHYDAFRKACKLMGWRDDAPHRGAGRLVVAVVCQDMTVTDAATLHIGAGRAEAVKAAGMDRLREGLYALATVWRLC